MQRQLADPRDARDPVAGELLITPSKRAFWRNGSASLISRIAAIHSDRDARWRPGRPSLPLHRNFRYHLREESYHHHPRSGAARRRVSGRGDAQGESVKVGKCLYLLFGSPLTALHHFTRLGQVDQLVGAREADSDLGFMACRAVTRSDRQALADTKRLALGAKPHANGDIPRTPQH